MLVREWHTAQAHPKQVRCARVAAKKGDSEDRMRIGKSPFTARGGYEDVDKKAAHSLVRGPGLGCDVLTDRTAARVYFPFFEKC